MKYKSLLIAFSLSVVGCSTNTAKNQTAIIKTQIAIEYIKQGDVNSAKNALDDALERNPSNAQANMMMGVTYQLDGTESSFKKAEPFFLKAIALDPYNPQIRTNYGQFLFIEKKYNEAIEQFSKAADSVGYDGRDTAFNNLGYSYLEVNNLAQAKTSFLNALRNNPNYADSFLGLAKVNLLEKNNRNAEYNFNQYMKFVRLDQMDAKALLIGMQSTSDQNLKNLLSKTMLQKFPNATQMKSITN